MSRAVDRLLSASVNASLQVWVWNLQYIIPVVIKSCVGFLLIIALCYCGHFSVSLCSICHQLTVEPEMVLWV